MRTPPRHAKPRPPPPTASAPSPPHPPSPPDPPALAAAGLGTLAATGVAGHRPDQRRACLRGLRPGPGRGSGPHPGCGSTWPAGVGHPAHHPAHRGRSAGRADLRRLRPGLGPVRRPQLPAGVPDRGHPKPAHHRQRPDGPAGHRGPPAAGGLDRPWHRELPRGRAVRFAPPVSSPRPRTRSRRLGSRCRTPTTWVLGPDRACSRTWTCRPRPRRQWTCSARSGTIWPGTGSPPAAMCWPPVSLRARRLRSGWPGHWRAGPTRTSGSARSPPSAASMTCPVPRSRPSSTATWSP